jgi:DnaJ homolog subfamily A member 2
MFFGNRGNAGNQNDTEYYDELGLDKSADESQIKKAYRKMAMKWHPDRNKDDEKSAEVKFKKVSEAYSVLSDPKKRETYDRFGKQALEGAAGGGGGVNPFDIFGSMFGDDGGGPFGGMGGSPFGGMFGGGRPRERPIEPVVSVVECTLDEIYKGVRKKCDFTRTTCCKICSGIGTNDRSNIDVCSKCKGNGKITTMNQIGPGMISQSTSICDRCSGNGKSIAKGKECKACHGEGLAIKKCRIELNIDAGIEDNHKIKYANQGNQTKDGKQGDLVFIIKIMDHNIFERIGNNLKIKKQIKLSEALTGVEMIINRLCGKSMVIRTRSSDIIVPNSKRIVHGMGMPILNSRLFGDLVIDFEIEFPSELTSQYKGYLRKLLPCPDKLNIDKSKVKIYKMDTIQEHQRGEYDSDDQDEHGGIPGMPGMGQAVECAQQ